MARTTRTRRIALAAGLPAAAAAAALIASAAGAATSSPATAQHSVKPAVVETHHHGRHVEPGDLRGRANEPGEDARGAEREPGDERVVHVLLHANRSSFREHRSTHSIDSIRSMLDSSNRFLPRCKRSVKEW